LVAVLVGLISPRNPAFWSLTLVPAVALAGWAALRISVEADHSELIVRNTCRTYRIPWTQIREVGRASFYPSLAAFSPVVSPAYVKTDTGRRIVIQASLGEQPQPDIVRLLRRGTVTTPGVLWKL